MAKKRRANFAREREKRSLVDSLSTRIVDKNGKVVFRGLDDADTLIKRVLRR